MDGFVFSDVGGHRVVVVSDKMGQKLEAKVPVEKHAKPQAPWQKQKSILTNMPTRKVTGKG